MANFFGIVQQLSGSLPSYKTQFSTSVPAANISQYLAKVPQYGQIEQVTVPSAPSVPKAVLPSVPTVTPVATLQQPVTKLYQATVAGPVTKATYNASGVLQTSEQLSVVPAGAQITKIGAHETIPVTISVAPTPTSSPVSLVTQFLASQQEQVSVPSSVSLRSTEALVQPSSPTPSLVSTPKSESAVESTTSIPQSFGTLETVPSSQVSPSGTLKSTFRPVIDVQPIISAAPQGSAVTTIDVTTARPVAIETVPAAQLETGKATPVIKLSSTSIVSGDTKTAQEQKLRILSASPSTPISEFTTVEFKKARFVEWLDDNSSLGLNEHQKEQIKKYAWDSIPFISQKQLDGASIADFYDKLELIQKGVEYSAPQPDTPSAPIEPGEGGLFTITKDGKVIDLLSEAAKLLQIDKNPNPYDNPVTNVFLPAEFRLPAFSKASISEQKEALRVLTKNAAESGLPVGFLAQAQQILVGGLPEGTPKNDLTRYIQNGELENDLKQDTLWYVPNQAKLYAMTREGQMSIGAGFTALAVVGGLVTGGIGAGVVGLGMAQFQSTELANLFGGDIWRTKEDLKMSGDLAYERLNEYDEEKNSVVKLISSYDVNKEKFIDPVTGQADETTRLRAYGEVVDAYNKLKVDLGDNAVYLTSVKGYETAVKELGWLANQIDSLAQFTPKSTLPTPITLIPPEGGRIVSSEFSAGKGDPIDLTRSGTGTLTYQIFDKKGNLVKSDDVSYFPGIGPIIKDYSSEIAFKSLQEETTKAAKVSDVPVTIYLKAGQTAENIYGKWTAGSVDKVVGFNAPEGTPVQTMFSQSGKKPDVLTAYPNPTIPNQLGAELEDAYVTSTKITKGIVNLDLKPTQTLYINGVMQDPKLNDTGIVLPQGTYSIVVKEGGYEDVTKNLIVQGGEVQQFSVQGQEEYGGGGGGGGGGGEVNWSGAAIETMIVFGTSLAGARIWLDDVEVQPEIGKAYATTPGYHAVKATKEGFQEWSKTVYAMEGKTLNVDAAFVETTNKITIGDGSGNGDGTITPTTQMSHVTFGQSVVGASVYIDDVLTSVEPGVVFDLPYGYHGILIKKTGKVDWLKNVYLAIGDTLTVSPSFEDVPEEVTTPVTTPTSTTKRVYINSNPSGSKILIGLVPEGLSLDHLNNWSDSDNGITLGFTGEWSPGYLNLERGLYKLQLTQSGYKTQESFVWVGDVIAFGSTAKSLAQGAGWLST